METMQNEAARIADVMAKLAELDGGSVVGEDAVRRHDNSWIAIPQHISLEDAAKALLSLYEAERAVVAVERVFKYRPDDGARATAVVLRNWFGWMIPKGVYNREGYEPPQMRNITTATGEETIPVGRVTLPEVFGRGAYMDLSSTIDPEMGRVFSVEAYCLKQHTKALGGLFRMIEEQLDNHSIYRGHAITASETPTFMNLAEVDPDDVVYSESVMAQLRALVWLSITKPEALKARKMLTKRLTVLYGRFGVGKTMAVLLTARLCVQHGVTFILCRPGVDDWRLAMQMVAMYGGVVVIEDIDVVFGNNNARGLSQALDILDGMQAKGGTVQLLGTTNHVDRLPKGILRFGRTDAIIEIGNLDRPGVEKLTRRFVEAELAPDVDFDAVYAATPDFTPSSIHEMIKRATFFMEDQDRTIITTYDLVTAADGMKGQLKLHEDATELVPTDTIDGLLQAKLEQASQEIRDEMGNYAIDYDAVRSQVDDAVEYRINGATVVRSSDGEDWGELRDQLALHGVGAIFNRLNPTPGNRQSHTNKEKQ